MARLLHTLITEHAQQHPQATALVHRQVDWNYAALATLIQSVARGLLAMGLERGDRVAVYLPKRVETVAALFGTTQASGVFVPINPLLKPEQVAYILRDCGVKILITARERADALEPLLSGAPIEAFVCVDAVPPHPAHIRPRIAWLTLLHAETARRPASIIDADMAAILYTSGSTGKPKGVVLSHRNMVAGAASVADYLDNTANDRILAVLPFSFDYGLSQLTTAFTVGACAVLMDYLLPRDVITAVTRDHITGLAAVPPLWVQLAQQEWPASAVNTLRYFTNSGGPMPKATLSALRRALPKTTPYLMYGLTEAFRSTYLPPEEIDKRPDSIGKAIPNAEILVVREDGTPCAPGEEGELVHRGALVAMGYWNDPEKTAERYRPVPGQNPALPLTEWAVWSGDTVRIDEEGYLYFVGRKDDLIKTSGYRVSPTEIEEEIYSSGMVTEAAAFGVAHPTVGQAIVVMVKPSSTPFKEDDLITHCKKKLPNFMLPARILVQQAELPRNPNGKIDRRALADSVRHLFSDTTA